MPFDRAYYRRFYEDPRTAVITRAQVAARARLIASFVALLELPVRRILDAGCGPGLFRAPLLRHFRRASYLGLESSGYLCERYGWRHGALQDLRTRERFDLVVCHDVLQYLGEPDARRAIAALGRVCKGALYFGALTREDWRDNCDQARTDKPPGLRTARFYRRELSRAFRPAGCGLWLARSARVSLWSLETPG